MVTHVRVNRQDHTGRSLVAGPNEIGWIVPGRLAFTGFRDASAAAAAADIAVRIVRQWSHGRLRAPRPDDTLVSMLPDGPGFECRVPENTWHATLLELAQLIHSSTHSFRNLTSGPAA